jgi:hypothetical protein
VLAQDDRAGRTRESRDQENGQEPPRSEQGLEKHAEADQGHDIAEDVEQVPVQQTGRGQAEPLSLHQQHEGVGAQDPQAGGIGENARRELGQENQPQEDRGGGRDDLAPGADPLGHSFAGTARQLRRLRTIRGLVVGHGVVQFPPQP